MTGSASLSPLIHMTDLAAFSREFAASHPRPFTARYDPYTQGIELLDTKDQIIKNMRLINREAKILMEAMHSL